MKRVIRLVLLIKLAAFLPIAAASDLALLAAQSREALDQGRYTQAEALLQHTAEQADAAHDAYWQTWTQTMQGYLALQRRQFETAGQLLNTALASTESHGWSGLAVRVRLYRGQLRQHNGQWPQADDDFAAAMRDSAPALPDLALSALLHRAGLAQQRLAYRESGEFLQTAERLLPRLPQNAAKAHLTLDLGYRYLQLRQADAAAAPLENVFNSLNDALTQARNRHLPRQMAQALGYLSDLYRLEGRTEEVAPLLQQGIFYAQQSAARDVLLRLEWRLGRYYAGSGRQDAAIDAYRRAVAHIQALRQDIPVTYENGRSSFRDTLAPAYLELAELLFAKTSNVPEAQRQALLQEAQATVELIKKSELEDYFQNRCEVPSQPLNAGTLPAGTAALYPVIFPRHLDLLVLTRTGLRHFSSPVAQAELQAGIYDLAEHLRNYDDAYLAQAGKLYEQLIRPAATLLQEQRIEHLIYIPDGPLRLIPLSALYDGAHYVLENYAVTVSPGLSVSGAETSARQNEQILLAGLSAPGEVVKELPETLLQGLLLQGSENLQRGALARGFSQDAAKMRGAELRALLADSSVIRKLQRNLQLPSVTTEINGLSKSLQHSTKLMNEAFTLQNFSEQLHNTHYRILHIASHGFFGGTEQNSFIMTYDRILDMSRFDALLHPHNKNRRRAPELITLSACQTAEGDDRSPLGISGVAIKAKVKNVLGSLWSVSDAATTVLMGHFYRNMQNGLSKAEALRQAQVMLLHSKEFAAAPFWSPFILVGEAQ